MVSLDQSDFSADPVVTRFDEPPTIVHGGRIRPLRLGPGQITIDVARRRSVDAAGADILTQAVGHPSHAPSLSEFLATARSTLIVVNDATRPTPTAAMLQAIRPAIRESSNWRVIVATGLHRAPNEAEKHTIFAEALAGVRERLLIHDGHSIASLESVDTRVGPVEVNRGLVDADRVIVLTSVEPHFFAGYSGGRKSLIPGLAGFATVERSHAGAMSTKAAPLQIGGNPVRDYIRQAASFLPNERIWALQVVLDGRNRVAAAFAGDIDKTFEQACATARNFYAVSVPEPYDIVLSTMQPPLDINLYQAQKGWEHAQGGVRDGGVLIVASPCRDGVGSSFYEHLGEMFPNQQTWANLDKQPYTMGLHKLVRTARARARFRLMAVTDLQTAQVASFGYEAFNRVQDAVNAASGHVGTPARMLIVEDGGLTTLVPQTAG